MKTISLYQCELCGTQYKSRLEAIECENGHKRIKDIRTASYVSCKVDRTGKPTKVIIAFDDGSEGVYKR